jgi:hypothetical protein
VSLIVSFWFGFQKLHLRWDSGDNNYCYLIIPVFIYLLWDRRSQGSGFRVPRWNPPGGGQQSCIPLGKQGSRRKEDETGEESTEEVEQSEKYGFRFGEFSWNVLGIIPVLLSIGLIFVGELGSVETLMYMGIWGCVVGIVFTLYGWRIRYLIFPLIILAFIVPLPPFINRMLTFQLKLAASSIAVLMLRGTGLTVFQEGNIIDLGITQLQVVDACSGMRYLMPLILIALLVGHFYGK